MQKSRRPVGGNVAYRDLIISIEIISGKRKWKFEVCDMRLPAAADTRKQTRLSPPHHRHLDYLTMFMQLIGRGTERKTERRQPHKRSTQRLLALYQVCVAFFPCYLTNGMRDRWFLFCSYRVPSLFHPAALHVRLSLLSSILSKDTSLVCHSPLHGRRGIAEKHLFGHRAPTAFNANHSVCQGFVTLFNNASNKPT